MPAIVAELVPRAADDLAVRIACDPEPHPRCVQPAEREVDAAQERGQVFDVLAPHTLKIHTPSQPPEECRA